MRLFWLSVFFFCYALASGQTDSLPSYFIDDQEVVLEFDTRVFDQHNDFSFNKVFEMEGVDVLAMIKTKEAWPLDGWQVRKVAKHVYQLRKKIDSFNKPVAQLSKYLINGDHWVQPTSEIEWPLDTFSTFDLEQNIFKISEQGNTSFALSGFPKAKQVILSGNFNRWDEQEIKMNRSKDGWHIQLDLIPGIYEYKFIVDGEWMHDPANELSLVNEHETLNSILLVGNTISFKLPDHHKARKVILSGSFNNWNEETFTMTKSESGWRIDVPLPPGKHYYKFIIDGEWVLDPLNDLQQHDRHGRLNSVLLIQ